MKIGVLSLPLTGHLNPMTALARKLQARGNEVTYFGVPDVGPNARAAGLRFASFGEKEFPVGSTAQIWQEVAARQGLDVIRYTVLNLTPALLKTTLEQVPERAKAMGIEAMVLDFAYLFAELVPMQMEIPYVHVYPILHVDFSAATPLCIYGWPYEATPEAQARNVQGLQMFGEMTVTSAAVAQAHARKVGLQVDWETPLATLSKLGIIAQTPREFDFPIPELPPQFHYAGPFHDDHGREEIPFPWEKLTGKPLIYASLGTLVNGLDHVYKSILRTVERLPEMQVVLSVGRNIDLAALGEIPANTIVVRSAPQIALLKLAALCITHAGMNTALESLAQGVPMVAIPIGYDQPGVAARIAYHGVGEFVDVSEVTAERLSVLVDQVLANPSYRDKAQYFKEVIAQTRGLDVAADVIERAFADELKQVAAD